MSSDVKEPDPGRPKAVTNTDEQEVAVNHSTADHGYDEPASSTTPAAGTIESEKQAAEAKKKEQESEKKGKPSQSNKNF